MGEQLTVKALVVGLLLGFCFALLMQRMALVTGWVPGFQVRFGVMGAPMIVPGSCGSAS
jgi:hypothetical protein